MAAYDTTRDTFRSAHGFSEEPANRKKVRVGANTSFLKCRTSPYFPRRLRGLTRGIGRMGGKRFNNLHLYAG